MVALAARWKGAAWQAAELLSTDKKAALQLSRQTTKADLDAYLMRQLSIDETTARSISNELTAHNIPDDRSADLADFANEPWFVLVADKLAASDDACDFRLS